MSLLRFVVIGSLVNACGGTVAGGNPHAAAQSQPDAGVDASADAGTDSGADSGASVVLHSGYAYTLAVDGRDLFFTSGDVPGVAVKKCSIDDCSAPTTVVEGSDGLPGIALDANAVYWTSSFK